MPSIHPAFFIPLLENKIMFCKNCDERSRNSGRFEDNEINNENDKTL